MIGALTLLTATVKTVGSAEQIDAAVEGEPISCSSEQTQHQPESSLSRRMMARMADMVPSSFGMGPGEGEEGKKSF